MNKKVYLSCLIFLVLTINSRVWSQCHNLIDGTGASSTNPYWVNCSGGSYTLFLQANEDIGQYTVDYGDGSPIENGNSLTVGNFLTHNYAAALDTFIVTLTDISLGCSVQGVVVQEVAVSASIQIPAGNPISGCTPANFLFRNNSTNVSPTTRFVWNFGDGSVQEYYGAENFGQTIPHTYLPGTTNCNVGITLTATNYCNVNNPSINTYSPIMVWDRDNVAITPSEFILCYPNTTVTLSNTTNLNCYALGNNGQRFEYWNFGDYWGKGKDSIIQWQPFSPPNRPPNILTYPGIGSYRVMLMDSSFCGKDTNFVTIQIINPPTANFNKDKDTICQGDKVTFTNISTGTNFEWSFGDGSPLFNTSSLTPFDHVFRNPGTFNVRLVTVAGTCSDTIIKSVVVKPSPNPVFEMDKPFSCDSGQVVFTDFSFNVVSWAWSFGNGNTSLSSTPPVQHYLNPGNYHVSLTVVGTNGCSSIKNDSVQVFQSPISVIIPPAAICMNTPLTFLDSSITTPGNPVTGWEWSFGDGGTSTTSAPVHTYTTGGSFSITLKVSTAYCSGNIDTNQIIVHSLPTSSFVFSPGTGCSPLTVGFTDQSLDASGYLWTFGDNATDSISNPNHIFINGFGKDTSYTVIQTVTNQFGCTDTSQRLIYVNLSPLADFTSDAVPACSPFLVNFTNNTQGGSTYNWDFGDSGTSNSINPSHTFFNLTSYLQYDTISLIAVSSRGCRDTVGKQIEIYPKPDFQITYNPSNEGCHPFPVSFSTNSSGIIYNWNFDDGTSSNIQNPNHIFNNSGSSGDSIFNVSMIVVNPFFCRDTVTQNIVVHPKPTASFTVTPVNQTYPSRTVVLQNLSAPATGALWNFGDSTTSIQNNPQHQYATWGNYDINLISNTIYGCTDTSSESIIINAPKPLSNIRLDNKEGCKPLKISFSSDSSQYHRSVFWDFGDGGSSQQPNLDYTFYNAGTFRVKLTVSGDGGVDSTFSDITVNETPVPFFTINPSVVFLPTDPMYCYNLSQFSENYQWLFGDGTTSNEVNPIHLYKDEGKYDITLIATNSKGCKDTVTLNSIVSVEKRSDIIFPNAFTPSADGPNGGYYDRNSFDNKIFFPITKGLVDYHFMIYNRWGELMFETSDVNIGWDGYYKGKSCPQDVYVWKVVAKNTEGKPVEMVGDVTLLK